MDILTAYMPYGTGYVYVKSKDQKYQVAGDVKNQTDLIISNFQVRNLSLGQLPKLIFF